MDMSLPFRQESTETDRLLTLSDGVIAIVITLLVLDITVPNLPPRSSPAVMLEIMGNQWPDFLGFILSFWVIGFYWYLHRRTFIHIERHEQGVVFLNLLFLLMVAFIPYATSVFTAYPTRFGIAFLSGILAMTGFVLALLWGYVSRKDLLEEGLSSRVVRIQAARFLASPLVFCLSIFLAGFDATLALLSWALLIPINGVLVSRLTESLETPSQPA